MTIDNTEGARAQIGVTGLAVMGSNIARNLARHGHTVALHNRSVAKTDALLADYGKDGDFVRTETIEEFVGALQKPRRVLIMVKAGDPTDAVIAEFAAIDTPESETAYWASCRNQDPKTPPADPVPPPSSVTTTVVT